MLLMLFELRLRRSQYLFITVGYLPVYFTGGRIDIIEKLPAQRPDKIAADIIF